MAFNSIGIVGGGAWGTALAQVARRSGHEVLVWAYEPETIAAINEAHENRIYLPGVQLDAGVRATAELSDIAHQDMVLMVAPAQFVRAAAAELAPHLPAGRPVVICAKGIEQGTGKLMSQVLAEALPQARLAVLSGPSFAGEVARGLPAAVTLACADQALGRDLAHAVSHGTFRTYWSDDLIGAQIGGAIKNVLAIAAGIVAGKRFGASAHAALTTRGFAEMVRLGTALGAQAETMTGLSGLGDLILTCSSPQSRNMSLGQALGEGCTLQEVLGSRTSVAEGVYTASAVAALAHEKGVEMPICAGVHRLVSGASTVDAEVDALLARPLKAEVQ